MQGNPGNIEQPTIDVFAIVFSQHFYEGKGLTKSQGLKVRGWTDKTLAAHIGVHHLSVRDWRLGKSVPRRTSMHHIISAFFGNSDMPDDDRDKFYAAWLGAKLARLRSQNTARAAQGWSKVQTSLPDFLQAQRALTTAEPDPAGEKFVSRMNHIEIDRRAATSDHEAARNAGVREDHKAAQESALKLIRLVIRQHNQLSDAWSDLQSTLERFVQSIDRPTEKLPDHLVDLYQAAVSLGSLLEQDRDFRDRPEFGESPLPAQLKRLLEDAVVCAAVLVRAFPSNQQRDGRLRAFWRPDDLPAARQLAEVAQACKLLPHEDNVHLKEMETIATRDGVQGDKTKGRFVATLRNLLLASAGSLVLSGYANESPLIRRISGFLVRSEEFAGTLLTGVPSDVSAAIRSTIERAKEQPKDKILLGIIQSRYNDQSPDRLFLAFVFPGQGSQAPGMGRDLADAFPIARETFQEVDDALGQKLSRIMFEGPAEELTLTANAQPALMAVSVAICRVLAKGGSFDMSRQVSLVAGHSLGEYSALTAAGSFDLATAARLLRLRGDSMQAAVPPGEGAMAALLGAEADLAARICAWAAQGEVLEVANDNGGGQVVISGAKAAVERAVEAAKTAGIKRAMILPVSAPFHCAMMAPAARVMEEALGKAAMAHPAVPVVANVTAAPVSDPDVIRGLLVKQVTGTVRWRECVAAMVAAGCTRFAEVGAGKVLTGLMKRNAPEATALAINNPADIEAFLKSL